ncbi:MAG: nitrous oxidase accessory protein [Myxococcota bacterium]|jgi:nitrous oxidase accessory protein
MIKTLTAALMALLFASDAHAETLVVGRDAPTVQATLDAAQPGDTVELPAGTWTGPATITKTLTLRGTGGVLDGNHDGTVLRVEAPGVVVDTLTIRRSGADLRGPDSCIWLAEQATASVIKNSTLSECAFGIWLNKVRDAKILDNRIHGAATGHRSNRGNGIQLFDSRGLLVKGNYITDGRDGIYVSATVHSTIEHNRAERTRYGVHYMFSYDNTVRHNVMADNGSGFALMGSLRIVVHDNVARDNEAHGVLLRDVQFSTIRDNDLSGNGEGLFMYSSTENTITDNRIAGNAVGAKVWAGSKRNRVSGNAFIGNRRQVFYVSTQDLVWGTDAPGNFWGDYLGWDQDGDGIGDRPYEVDSFSAHMVHKYPAAALLLRSPALELLGHLEARMPLLAVPTVVDRRPMMKRKQREVL